MDTSTPFSRYLRFRSTLEDPFVELDLSHAELVEADVEAMRPGLAAALTAMRALEGGSVANVDEQRQVGHFWLRAPGIAPDAETGDAIRAAIDAVESFAASVHSGAVAPPEGGAFKHVVLCGIGGSALGPMLLADALAKPSAPMSLTVLDNTDPEGIDAALGRLGSLASALVVVISKSGGTPETRNGMLEVQRAIEAQGLAFGPRAVAITTAGSKLDARAKAEGWLMTLPMWDWVGGRTSVTSAVGLLPGALIGMDVRGFLAGAAAMDDATRSEDVYNNQAAMLAAYWHHESRGRGERAMVVLPYKDRLLLLSRYLQQLVMESLGKELDRAGARVHQGLTVYGNKGSTDQHAFVQQLRDGRHDFFVTFVRVLRDREQGHFEVEPGVTTGDYLDGFWQGTRRALRESGRSSATICVDRIDARVMGALVALFERAVAIYAELIDTNAFHQPGVEAGKQAAAEVLALQARLLEAVTTDPKDVLTLAAEVGAEATDCWSILLHLAVNRRDVHCAHRQDPARAVFRRD